MGRALTGRVLMGPPGALWAGSLCARLLWASLGPDGPYASPMALMGRALMGRALMGLPGCLWDLMGQARMGQALRASLGLYGPGPHGPGRCGPHGRL